MTAWKVCPSFGSGPLFLTTLRLLLPSVLDHRSAVSGGVAVAFLPKPLSLNHPCS
jgi:hypothetical protein